MDGGAGPGLRIGVDLGSFLLGRLPDASLVDAEDKRTVLGAMGALMEGAEPGTVVVSAAGAPFLARGFDLSPLGTAPGRRVAFRLGGLERGEAAGGRRTRFVGRDHELELLRSRLAAAVRGQGQVVAVAGEAGIGKSRLVVELRRGLSGQQVLCLEGHCLPYATPIPCRPLVELLRAASAIVETDGPDGVRDKLRATLDRAGMDALAATPYLLHLLDPGEGGEALGRLSPEVVKARTFEILRELSRRLAGRVPLVLVVEDLHWVDRTSEEYLGTLVDVVAGARILLVTTHRPGYRPPWMDRSYATQIALQPLSARESMSLVRDVIGPTEVDEPTVEMIVAKAEGNPFFTEELARAVVEGGSLAPGAAVPDTVEGVLMARIDRLSAEDKRVLQAAAVIGRSLPFLLLQAILDPADELLREGGLAELGEFTQAQPVLEEALRIAETINHPYSQTFLALGEGILRVRQGDLPKAVSTLERSLALCRQWKLAALFGVIAGHLGAAYTLAGRTSEAIPLLEEALEREHRHWLLPFPSLALAEAYLRTGRTRDASRQADRALDLARQRGQRGHEAWIKWLLGEIAAQTALTGELGVGEQYREALVLATELGMRPLVAHCHSGLGRWYRRTGDGAKAAEHLAIARALYRDMNVTLWLAQVEAEPPAGPAQGIASSSASSS